LSKEPQQLDIIRLSGKDLGIEENVTPEEFFKRAKERGFEFVPPELALWYRLSHLEQPIGELIYIAMKPILLDGYPNILAISRGEKGIWLYEDGAGQAQRWGPKARFVFSISKKYQKR
jgi:hypothetical protein